METFVVGIDGSTQSRQALQWAVTEAARTGAAVEAVHAWQVLTDPTGFGPTPDADQLERSAHALLDGVIAAVDQGALAESIRRVVKPGSPGQVLVERAEDADLLVVGTRGRGGFLSLLLGSTAEDCVHRSPCPLILVPPDSPPPSGLITVGVDGSAESLAALRWAAGRRADGAPLLVALYALNWHDQPSTAEHDFDFSVDDARAWLDKLIAEANIDRASISLEVVNDVPSRALVDRSQAGDIVVVGSRGAGRTKSFIVGSTARQLSRHAASPLVVHRRAGADAGPG